MQNRVLGIDLGTTYSALAIVNALGEPDIVANALTGERTLPSAVYFPVGGGRLVGSAAINGSHEDMSRAVRWIKRQMGDRQYRITIDGQAYTPADVAGYILRELAGSARAKLGAVNDTVIAVPVDFGDEARRATLEAGRRAGLNILGLVEEPVAAATYFAARQRVTGEALVFDLGGGTADAALVQIEGGNVKVLASRGEAWLGGTNIDQRLVMHFAKQYAEKFSGARLFTDNSEKADIDDYAEETKRQLKDSDCVPYRLRGAAGTLTGTLTREEFRGLIENELDGLRQLLDNLLAAAGRTPQQIRQILLVGGSTRLTAVREMLTVYFGRAPLELDNVDEIVALGTALYAQKLQQEQPAPAEEEQNYAGIDLGTTYSAIARLTELGRPEVIPNRDGERVMPSALYFTTDNRVLVGSPAVRSRLDDTSRSVRWIKREMGREDYHFTVNGRAYKPAELSASILEKLARDAQSVIGTKPAVIITVPANFEEAARTATLEAGRLAGLNVIGLVNEPTAAAYYYTVTRHLSGRSLVFDLGGGTLDISIVDIGTDGTVQVVTSAGDRQLGGYDIDQRLLAYFAETYRREKGGELYENDEERAEQEDYAEEVKISLLHQDTVRYHLRGSAGRLQGELTLAEFNRLIAPELARMELLLETVLEKSGDTPQSIRNVLLAGGSTRLKAVRSNLASVFGREPELSGQVDEVVALGAALFAGKRGVSQTESATVLRKALDDIPEVRDVCNHSYGTIVLGQDKLTDQRVNMNDIIIPKDTPLPCTKTREYYTLTDGQETITAQVTQGESRYPEEVNYLAKLQLRLPPGTPQNSKVLITYSYNRDQCMDCCIEHVDSGRKATYRVNLEAGAGHPGGR